VVEGQWVNTPVSEILPRDHGSCEHPKRIKTAEYGSMRRTLRGIRNLASGGSWQYRWCRGTELDRTSTCEIRVVGSRLKLVAIEFRSPLANNDTVILALALEKA